MKVQYTLTGLLGVAFLAAGCAICSDNSRPSLLGGDADFSLLNTRNSRSVVKAIDADSNTMPATSTAAPSGGGSLTLGADAITNIIHAVAAGTALGAQKSIQLGSSRDLPMAAPVFPVVKYYTVEKGDCLSTIAQQFGCTVKELKKANNIKGTIIHPGDVLTIP